MSRAGVRSPARRRRGAAPCRPPPPCRHRRGRGPPVRRARRRPRLLRSARRGGRRHAGVVAVRAAAPEHDARLRAHAAGRLLVPGVLRGLRRRAPLARPGVARPAGPLGAGRRALPARPLPWLRHRRPAGRACHRDPLPGVPPPSPIGRPRAAVNGGPDAPHVAATLRRVPRLHRSLAAVGSTASLVTLGSSIPARSFF